MNEDAALGLLDEQSVVGYLRSRGVLEDGTARASVLAGGVSNVVLVVEAGLRRMVVKQSLGRLRVREEWHAPRERVLAEAAALVAARDLTPTQVPRLLHRDAVNHVIVMEAAPQDWCDWKTQLLRGDVAPSVGRQLGEVLGRWHRLTVSRELPQEVEDGSSFDALRLEPYYRTAARRLPEVSGHLLALADGLAARRICLVHGDFSPKNVLVDPQGEGVPLWVIDFEVAHRGDPVFDLAFMASHLTLKAIHRPSWAHLYDATLRGFLKGYRQEVREATSAGVALDPQLPAVLSHVGALLVARVVGRSPAEYLTQGEQGLALALGTDLLKAGPQSRSDVEDLFTARGRLVA